MGAIYTIDFAEAGWSLNRVQTCLGTDRRTVERWRARDQVPSHFARLIALEAAGHKPQCAPTWSGWRFAQDKLVFAPGGLLAVNLLRQLLASKRLRRRKARAEKKGRSTKLLKQA